jgi:Class II histone deacetylase complex subunits 2 and 3
MVHGKPCERDKVDSQLESLRRSFHERQGGQMRFRMKVPLLFRVFGSGFGVASPRRSTRQVRIDLIATGSDFERKMTQRPAMIIAFDTSFEAQDAQVCRMREPSDLNGSLIPIIYPMIINSAEHVDICISKRIPSAKRPLARPHLVGHREPANGKVSEKHANR